MPKTPAADFGQIASGRVLEDSSSGRFAKPAERAAGTVVGLQPQRPDVAEVHTTDGRYVWIAVNR